MSTELNSEEAAKTFLNMLITRAHDGAIEDITVLLEKGPPGRSPSSELVSLHHWFQSLDDDGRGTVLRIVQESVDSAVFGCLVLLDGMWGGYPIEGKRSDFAAYLQTYEDADKMRANVPQSKVRLNPPAIKDDLHDMFRSILRERSKPNN